MTYYVYQIKNHEKSIGKKRIKQFTGADLGYAHSSNSDVDMYGVYKKVTTLLIIHREVLLDLKTGSMTWIQQ